VFGSRKKNADFCEVSLAGAISTIYLATVLFMNVIIFFRVSSSADVFLRSLRKC
jgi:hypothetical protein